MTCYIAPMLVSGWAARGIVVDTWKSWARRDPRALMVGPLPLWPFSRQVIIDAGDHYEYGAFSWGRGAVTSSPEKISKNSDAPEVAAARRDNNTVFLVWARFPHWTLEPTGGHTCDCVRHALCWQKRGLRHRRW